MTSLCDILIFEHWTFLHPDIFLHSNYLKYLNILTSWSPTIQCEILILKTTWQLHLHSSVLASPWKWLSQNVCSGFLFSREKNNKHKCLALYLTDPQKFSYYSFPKIKFHIFFFNLLLLEWRSFSKFNLLQCSFPFTSCIHGWQKYYKRKIME